MQELRYIPVFSHKLMEIFFYRATSYSVMQIRIKLFRKTQPAVSPFVLNVQIILFLKKEKINNIIVRESRVHRQNSIWLSPDNV